MSHSEILKFPPNQPGKDNNPNAAEQARHRIAEIHSPYRNHATLSKEDLVGEIDPVSPAAELPAPVTAPPFAIRSGDHNQVNEPARQATTVEEKLAPQPAANPGAVPVNPLQVATLQPSAAQALPKVAPEKTSRLPGKLKPLITGVITFILLFLIFKSPIFLSQLGYLTHSKPKTATTTTETNATAAITADPVISIPKINVNAPVVYAQSNVEANIQKDLESGVVHYANTALPGENGNSVIFGHSSNDWWEPGNYKFVFVLLDKLQPGDTYTVNYQSKQYMYQVVSSRVVEPTDLSVLAQTPDPQMTLITCTPPGTSWKRLVVQAKQISPTPTEAKAATSSSADNQKGILPGNSSGITETLGNWWEKATHIFKGRPASLPDAK